MFCYVVKSYFIVFLFPFCLSIVFWDSGFSSVKLDATKSEMLCVFDDCQELLYSLKFCLDRIGRGHKANFFILAFNQICEHI